MVSDALCMWRLFRASRHRRLGLAVAPWPQALRVFVISILACLPPRPMKRAPA